MNVPENCIDRKRHPVPIGWILIPSDNRRKWAGLHFLDNLERDLLWNGWLERNGIFGEFPLLLLLLSSSHHEHVRGLPGCTTHFFGLKGKPYHVCFKYRTRFVFKVKLPLPGSQMMDFVFLWPEGQESGHFVFISPHGHFLLPTPGPSPCLRREKSVGPAQWPPLGQTQFWKPLCIHFLK